MWLITLYLCSENKKKNVDAWLVFFLFYSVQDPSSANEVTHIEGRSPCLS